MTLDFEATPIRSGPAEQVLDTVRRFVSNEIEPRAAQIDASNVYPWDLHEQAGELGLFGIALPEAYGGLGLDLRTRLEIIELVARSSGSFAIILSTWPDAVHPIVERGSEELKREILPRVARGEWCPALAMSEPSAGSDAASMKAEARKTQDGYILNGTKTWCTHGGMADMLVVFAKTDPDAGSAGISAFLIRKDDPGFAVVRDEDLFSVRGSPQSTLEFSDCFVSEDRRLGEEGEGFKLAMKALDEARLNVSAKALGAAHTSISIATNYARDRQAFGTSIINHQGLQFLLADLATEYAAARTLWLHAIAELEQRPSRRASTFASMAKLACTEIGMKAPVEAIQVLGATGLSTEVPLGRFMRDAKAYQIYDGTTQIHKMIIGRHLAREGFDLV